MNDSAEAIQTDSQAPAAFVLSLRQWLSTLCAGLVAGTTGGVVCWLFLCLLALATTYRLAHPDIVWGLPVAGLLLGRVLHALGKQGAGNSDLIIEAAHQQASALPWSRVPFVLLGSTLTHLFGGSAGREGAGVQMSANLADGWANFFQVRPECRADWLCAGVAAGFAATFQAPMAASLFAAEFFGAGVPNVRRVVASILGAGVGAGVANRLGNYEQPFPAAVWEPLSLLLCGKWLVFAAFAAALATSFVMAIEAVQMLGELFVPSLSARLALGGGLVVLAWQVGLPSEVLGLSSSALLRAFHDPLMPAWFWAQKMGATAVTVGTGYLGGEVTPLFVAGASLGNDLAQLLHLPLVLSAGMGMAAVFAAATNAPCTAALMACEKFGYCVLPHAVVVCSLTCLLKGRTGLYRKQRTHPVAHAVRSRWPVTTSRSRRRAAERGK